MITKIKIALVVAYARLLFMPRYIALWPLKLQVMGMRARLAYLKWQQ